MLSVVTADELICLLQVESTKAERFATRFILMEGCRAWDDAIPKLSREVDRVVRLSEFCSGPDVFPDTGRLLAYLREETRGCSSVLLIPLAECIRLDPESSHVIRLLAEWPADRIRRIYVPLLETEELFRQQMNRITRYRARELPEPWFLEGEGSSEIIAAPFSVEPTGRQIAQGIREYLRLWEQGSVQRVWLTTAMARWLPVLQSPSKCCVRLYPSSFDYVRKNVGWEEVYEEWGSDDQWKWLAVQVREGDSLDRLARRLLNVAGYDANQLFALWSGFDHYKRWFAWLWSKQRSKPGTFLHHVLRGSSNVDGLKRDATMAIFALPRSVAFSRERKELLRSLGVNLMPAEFWEAYRETPDPLQRVAVLTDLSSQEREQLVLCVGELASKYDRSLWWEYLEVAFPELAWYLQPLYTGDRFADLYFSAYRRCRLKDQVDEELTTLLAEWARRQLLWQYPTRSDLLAKQRALGAKVLWVDAMGVEWVGLLTQVLAQNADVDCEVNLAKGCLPTTTEANEEWEASESVVRGLDDIAHHYEYRFPQSFVQAIEFNGDVALKVLALLSQHPTVVITSDHGLSRFAATSCVKVDPPMGAEVKPRGRYALLLNGSCNYENRESWIADRDNAILLTHSRFSGGGACRGEVHGGATPEECLTPVIVIRKRGADTKVQLEVVTGVVRLSPRGEGILTVRSSRKVGCVELRVAGQVLAGHTDNGFTWCFMVGDLKTGKYTGKLYSANQLIDEIAFEVTRGIIQDDLGF